MTKAITVCLLIVGIINILPVLGLSSASKMEAAYGVRLGSSELIILMQHRALLFGIIGGFILISAFVPSLQLAAMVMASVSMLGFIILSMLQVEHNEALQKIVFVDWVGIAILGLVIVLKAFHQ